MEILFRVEIRYVQQTKLKELYDKDFPISKLHQEF